MLRPKPRSDLRVIFAKSGDPTKQETLNTVDFGFKNVGDDTAFVHSVRFVFYSVLAGCEGCYPGSVTEYEIDAEIRDKKMRIKGPGGKRLGTEGAPNIFPLSQVVPALGVDQIRVRFRFPAEMPVDPRFPRVWEIIGRAFFAVDGGREVASPEFYVDVRQWVLRDGLQVRPSPSPIQALSPPPEKR